MRSFIRAAAAAAVVLAGTYIPAQAFPPYDLTVINRTSSDMVNFYATRSSRDGWGRDHFGDYVLHPGQRWKINLYDGTGACVFDLLAKFEDGGKAQRYELNVCATSTWTVHGN